MLHYTADTWPVLGHDWAAQHLSQALNWGRLRHAYLLSGPPSVGKTTFGRGLAMALNCTSEAQRPCGQCRACRLIQEDKHPDIHLLESERVGGILKIEQIRNLQHLLALQPYEARYRVAIIRRFQEANLASANAFLKTLEEPPKRVIIILTTDNLHALLPTILSRCQHIPLQALSLVDTAAALEARWGQTRPQAELLAHLSGGRIGWAVQMIQQGDLLRQREDWIKLLETLLSRGRRERFAAMEEFHKDKPRLLELLQIWQTYWRDALLMAYGSRAWLTNIDRRDFLADLAKRPPQELRRALAATQKTQAYLNHNVATRLALEVMLLDYPYLKALKA
jgi:DNA polymerase-3 subunit delta'